MMRTFVDVLRDNAVHEDRAMTFVRADGRERRVSYRALWFEARRRARALRELGLARGDRVALVLPEPDEFVLTFLGALVGGLVAVPIYPPQSLAKLEAYGDTVRHVLSASGARALVISEALRPSLASHLLGAHAAMVLEHDLCLGDAPPDAPEPVALDDLAFLQFTSGSTSRPKGVMVTHRNLTANSQAIMFDGLRSTPEDRGVSWLPLYHDMGLIGFVIAPLYALVEVLLLPTSSFIRRPSLWLEAVHRFRGTITFAPNFAFGLAARAVTERQSAGWDLRCLRVLGCGAEPIQAETLRAFLERFAANGLSPGAVLPSYGMAEATLAVTFAPLGATLRTDRVDAEQLRAGRAAPPGGSRPVELVACGRPFPRHELVIRDADGAPRGEREIGEITVRGPSVASGYFGDEAATREAFRDDGWLWTGDLGYLADGELHICGRSKDLVIVHGKNYYPQDIERVVSAVDGVRDGQCVAFSRLDETGRERSVVLAEPRRPHGLEALSLAIAAAVQRETGLLLDEVHLIRRGTLPRTSSGKVRRREARARLERGELQLAVEGALEAAEDPASPPPDGEAPHVTLRPATPGLHATGASDGIQQA